ncbi:LysR substrate-binding domain-containing protein [Variovorax paradoxus]|uniref:LysR substrate-binding domain-containing protein n=1 Tax=Variovorax paradoxus TaxID=34073 RepID=UPI001ABCCD19
MKLHQLRDFVAVASTGSLRAAARRLGLTQPSLSKSIQQLEKELGSALFERHARGAVLSFAGRAFLPRAETVLNELQRAASELQHLGGAGGHVNMAVSAAAALTALPEALTEFRRRYPDAAVRVVSGTFAVMFSELRAGALDFSIGPRPAVSLSEEFCVEQLFTNTRAVVCRAGHPLRHARSLGELTEARWLVPGAMGLAAAEHDQVFLGLGLPVPRSVVQCEYPTALLSLLARTDMLAIVPRQYADARPFDSFLVEIPIGETLPGAEIVLIAKAAMPLTPAAEHMLTLLRRHIEYHVTAHRGGTQP